MIDKKSALKTISRELSQFPIFLGLKAIDIEALCEGGEVVSTSHRHALFHYDDDAHYFGIVLDGAYKLSKSTPSGNDVIIYFSTPGDVVAAFIMSQTAPKYPVSAIAMGPSRFLKLPRSTYLNQWVKYPEMILRLQNALSTRVGQLHNYQLLSKAPLATKVASLLMQMLQKSDDKNDLTLPSPLTRKEIADSLGASVESVIRVMSEWSKNGIIETKGHQIKILKLEKVIELMKQQ